MMKKLKQKALLVAGVLFAICAESVAELSNCRGVPSTCWLNILSINQTSRRDVPTASSLATPADFMSVNNERIDAVDVRPDYKSVVEGMLKKYPDSQLRDIYKSFFQDRFGPGHLVSDTMAARRYLHSELMEMEESAMPYYEPAGAGENYYRVSLAVIRDDVISEDEFFHAFLESAGKVTFPTIEDWTAEWNDILKVIPTDLENYGADKAMIDSVLSSGDYAVHHSRRFNASYHPHYRLIDKSTFQRLLLPRLRK